MLKERINRLEQGRIELEEEVSRHKSSVGEERLRGDEAVSAAKQRCRAEEVRYISLIFACLLFLLV